MTDDIIYTIGHSTHDIGYFISLLKANSISCLIDVRSVPASSYNPQFNKENLTIALREHGITYLHFATEFGARQTNSEVLDSNGKVDFDKVRKTKFFLNGVDRIRQGIQKGFIISLMCSESEPLDCHRFSMVSLGLQQLGFRVKHILKDNSILDNQDLEDLLLKRYEKQIPHPDLFNPEVTREQQLEVAYKLKNNDIGYLQNSTNGDDNHV